MENLFSLLLLQGANYLLPLVTLPYLLRTIGPERYGLVVFAQAFIQYFVMITDYGFNLSATREISINRESKKKVSEIFSSVIVIKFVFMVLSFLILTIIIFSFDKFKANPLVYYYTFGMVVGNVLFPTWYFQGIEKMKFITILNVLSKSIFTILLFWLIRDESDYILVPVINSIGSITVGCLSLLIIARKFSVKLTIPTLNNIKFHLREGWYVFVSTLSISLYTVTNSFLLGIFTNDVIVGYYASAEKVVQAFQNLLVPISQTIYPYINKLAHQSKEQAISFIKKMLIVVGSFSLTISIFIFIFSSTIITSLFGKNYSDAIIILKVLAFLPFIIGLSNMFGTQTLLVFNFKKLFTTSILMPAFIHTLVIFWAIPHYGAIGLASMTLFTELLIVSIRVFGISILYRNFFWEGSKHDEKIKNSF